MLPTRSSRSPIHLNSPGTAPMPDSDHLIPSIESNVSAWHTELVPPAPAQPAVSPDALVAEAKAALPQHDAASRSHRITQIVVFVMLVVVLQVVPAVIAFQTPIRSAPVWKNARLRPSAAPPGVVFGIVWPILYLLVASGLTLQATFPTSAKPAVRWAGVCLLAVTVVLTFAWTPVFVRSTVQSVTTATYMIVTMLCLSIPGVVLAYLTRPVAGVLLTPLPLWLSFALVLSFQALHNLKREAVKGIAGGVP